MSESYIELTVRFFAHWRIPAAGPPAPLRRAVGAVRHAVCVSAYRDYGHH